MALLLRWHFAVFLELFLGALWFFGGPRVGTQGHTLARQELSHLGYSVSSLELFLNIVYADHSRKLPFHGLVSPMLLNNDRDKKLSHLIPGIDRGNRRNNNNSEYICCSFSVTTETEQAPYSDHLI
jgi:hypothetical protein